jgi:hypothetical protein
MVRILHFRGMVVRSSISLAILSAVLLYGALELWHAAFGAGSTTASLFGVIFIAGAVYGLRQTMAETKDLVIIFDADPETGRAEIHLWRPFGRKVIETTLDKITGWRLWVQAGPRGQKAFLLLAKEASYDGTLRFALARGQAIPDLLREIAPEAIEDFERETGIRRDEDEAEDKQPEKSSAID